MKTIIFFAVIFLGIQFTALANSQKSITEFHVNPVKPLATSFSFIRGHKQGKNHTVTWGMTNNAGINHFMVECTYEDPYDPYSVWQSIGMMPCSNSPIFKFTDSPVLPGTLNYRVVAVMNDNSTVTSDFYSIYISGS
jgi:hypothetical protein